MFKSTETSLFKSTKKPSLFKSTETSLFKSTKKQQQFKSTETNPFKNTGTSPFKSVLFSFLSP